MKARFRPVEAEGGGFEPPVPKFEYVSLANWWFQPLTHPSKPISLKEWCKCREKKLLYKIIGAKNCGSACRRPKSLFAVLCPYAVVPSAARMGFCGVQMSFAGHLHAVYPENGIMVFSVWDAPRQSQIRKTLFFDLHLPSAFLIFVSKCPY